MNRWYVFIMCDTFFGSVNCGYCKDVVKTIKLFKDMPTLFFKPHRQNVLVYLEEVSSEEKAKLRLDEIMALTIQAKLLLVEKSNPDFYELVPGQNIDL